MPAAGEDEEANSKEPIRMQEAGDSTNQGDGQNVTGQKSDTLLQVRPSVARTHSNISSRDHTTGKQEN